MIIAVQDFLANYPRFSDRSPDFISLKLLESQLYCPTVLWGDYQQMGMMLLTAHLLEMEVVQDVETGGKGMTMAAGTGGSPPSTFEQDLQLTTYGRRFFDIRSRLESNTQSNKLDNSPFTGDRLLGIGFPL